MRSLNRALWGPFTGEERRQPPRSGIAFDADRNQRLECRGATTEVIDYWFQEDAVGEEDPVEVVSSFLGNRLEPVDIIRVIGRGQVIVERGERSVGHFNLIIPPSEGWVLSESETCNSL